MRVTLPAWHNNRRQELARSKRLFRKRVQSRAIVIGAPEELDGRKYFYERGISTRLTING